MSQTGVCNAIHDIVTKVDGNAGRGVGIVDVSAIR